MKLWTVEAGLIPRVSDWGAGQRVRIWGYWEREAVFMAVTDVQSRETAPWWKGDGPLEDLEPDPFSDSAFASDNIVPECHPREGEPSRTKVSLIFLPRIERIVAKNLGQSSGFLTLCR